MFYVFSAHGGAYDSGPSSYVITDHFEKRTGHRLRMYRDAHLYGNNYFLTINLRIPISWQCTGDTCKTSQVVVLDNKTSICKWSVLNEGYRNSCGENKS